MTHRSRAIGALISATTLLVVASCSSSTSTTSATQATPSALASTAASYSAPPTTTSAAPLPDSERWHPAKHLAPAAGWASNPSGLVYENGTYHAFYRHNPSGDDAAGAIDWAHATSTDLVNWTEQPVAIAGTADSQVLTGSIVVDQDNTSGLGTAEAPPMVAIYTTTGRTRSRPSRWPTAPTTARPGRSTPTTRCCGPRARTSRCATRRSSGTSRAATG